MAKKINKWVERLNSLSLKKDQELEAQNKKDKEWTLFYPSEYNPSYPNKKIKSKVLYKNGKQKVLWVLVGQIMKETKGQANPALVNKLLKERIG